MDAHDLAPSSLFGLALCAGGGGLELGLHIAEPRYRTVCYVERHGFAAATLVARMEDQALGQAPLWDDLATFDGSAWRGLVDIVSAGYPCQPFSDAGKRLGAKDPRHLWPQVARVIRECEPRRVFLENVAGHLHRGFHEVARELEGLGYRVAAGLFSAAQVGASHLRQRLFVLADADREPVGQLPRAGARQDRLSLRQGDVPGGDRHGRRFVDAAVDHHEKPGPETGESEAGRSPLFPPAPDDFGLWTRYLRAAPRLQPALPRGDDGLAHRVERARLLGNGVCPLAAAAAYRALDAALTD